MYKHENCGGELVRRPDSNTPGLHCKKCQGFVYTGATLVTSAMNFGGMVMGSTTDWNETYRSMRRRNTIYRGE